MPKYVVTLVKQSNFIFSICFLIQKMFICKEEPTICTMQLNKIRPNMLFTIAAALFSHKIYSINENAPTNKTIMSRMLPLEPIMVEGALCSKEKEKCVWGDFRLFVFKGPSQPSPFPSVHSSFYTYRLACIQTRTHLKSRPYTLLHVYNYMNTIVLKGLHILAAVLNWSINSVWTAK